MSWFSVIGTSFFLTSIVILAVKVLSGGCVKRVLFVLSCFPVALFLFFFVYCWILFSFGVQ